MHVPHLRVGQGGCLEQSEPRSCGTRWCVSCTAGAGQPSVSGPWLGWLTAGITLEALSQLNVTNRRWAAVFEGPHCPWTHERAGRGGCSCQSGVAEASACSEGGRGVLRQGRCTATYTRRGQGGRGALPTQHSHSGKAEAGRGGQVCLECLLIKCCFRGNRETVSG